MSFPTWSWSPPHLTSESGKETDDEVALSSSPALCPSSAPEDASGGLTSFLHNFLPAAAIKCFAEQCAKRAAAQDARQFRRKLPTQTEQRLADFADWSAALSERYEVGVCNRRHTPAHLTEVKDLTEVFYARWLRLQARCPRHDLVTVHFAAGEESRQRRCCHQTSQKKVKWSFFRDTKALSQQLSSNVPDQTVVVEANLNRENVQ